MLITIRAAKNGNRGRIDAGSRDLKPIAETIALHRLVHLKVKKIDA
jgi:hypothetical protein